MPNQHGGPRPRSGRPPGPHPGAAHRTRRMLLLNDGEYQQARDLGEGNASAGVRLALALANGRPQGAGEDVHHFIVSGGVRSPEAVMGM